MAGTGHRNLADLHSERDQTINPTRSHPTTWPNAVGGVPGAHSQKFIHHVDLLGGLFVVGFSVQNVL
jgi:hypothetical protein